MRKCKLLSAILLVFVIFTTLAPLTSCHGKVSADEFVAPETFDENQDVNIVFWAKNENNVSQQAVYRKAVADFKKIYPNINITLKLYSDYNDIYRDVITNTKTGTTPNICITYPDHIATYMTGNNVIVPLDSLMTHEKYGFGGSELKFDGPTMEEMIPQFLSEGVINGTQYAIPFMRSTEACYINKTLLAKLGYDEIPEVLTWEWIWQVSEEAIALGKDENGNYNLNGQKVLVPFIYKSTDNMMIQFLKQNGAGYSTENGDILIFNDTTESFLYEIESHTRTGAFSIFNVGRKYPGNFLNTGQCIFGIDSTAGATWIGPNAPQIEKEIQENLVDCEIVVRPIPQYDPNNPQMISQGPSICIFNKKNTDEVMASWLFVQYLLTNEVQIAYSQTEGYLPVTSKAYNSTEYQDYLSRGGEDNDFYYHVKIDATKLLLDNLDNTFITPVFNGSTSLRNAAGGLIFEIVKSVDRTDKVDDAYMQEVYRKVSSLYHIGEIDTSGRTKINFTGLPTQSIILLVVIASIWVLMGGYYVAKLIYKRLKNNKS